MVKKQPTKRLPSEINWLRNNGTKNHRKVNMDLHRLCTFSKASTINFNRKHMFQSMAVGTNIQFNISEAMEDILMVTELDYIRFPLFLDELPQRIPCCRRHL